MPNVTFTPEYQRVINKIGAALGMKRNSDEDGWSWLTRVRFNYEQAWAELATLEQAAAKLRRQLQDATNVLIEDRLLG